MDAVINLMTPSPNTTSPWMTSVPLSLPVQIFPFFNLTYFFFLLNCSSREGSYLSDRDRAGGLIPGTGASAVGGRSLRDLQRAMLVFFRAW